MNVIIITFREETFKNFVITINQHVIEIGVKAVLRIVIIIVIFKYILSLKDDPVKITTIKVIASGNQGPANPKTATPTKRNSFALTLK